MQFSTLGYQQTIMVECGFNWKEIIKRAIAMNGKSILDNVSACLITHGHSDHARGIKQVMFNGIDTFASEDVHNQYGTTARGINIKDGETKCIAPDLFVTAFKVEHDYPNSLGFIIKCTKTNEMVLFVNDCKYFTYDLSNFVFDYIFMECNYEDRTTYAQYNQAVKNNDKIKEAQYYRVIHSHMSLNSTKKNLSKLNLNNVKGIFLMHLSDRNANEYQMKNEIRELTRKQVLVCQKNGGIK